jgi:tryptophan halogenase
MKQGINKIVVVGGGTAGWMSAALIKKVLGEVVDVTLVESEDIGTIGVGEATIPPIRHFNAVLGLDEVAFVRETRASIKLGIKFDNWRVQGEGYFHTFGEPGRTSAFCRFHDYWLRARKELEDPSSLWDYDLNYLAATAGKFARMQVPDPALDIPYAYHFDAGHYAQFLRKFSEPLGVSRIEGKIIAAQLNSDTGFVERLHLESGGQIDGDLFIDCTGFRGLLIQQKLNTGFEDWSHWLPCDRAMAVPSERFSETLPYTRAIAHRAGWQWRIPLQHRNGNGLVFSSAHMSEDEAQNLLLGNLQSKALAEPKLLKFRTGRRRKQWHKNVVAVGLSSGFLEPLESTSIHLIQSAIVRLLKLFPHSGICDTEVDEYNRQSQIEYEQIRDFIILHYHVNERNDSDFWRQLNSMDIPPTLARKIELFRRSGKLFREQEDLFFESSWLQVLIGQGVMPERYHPMAGKLTADQLRSMLNETRQLKQSPLTSLPSHDQFLSMFCGQ